MSTVYVWEWIFTTLLQSVMFCFAAVPMASLGEAPRLVSVFVTTMT